MKPFLRCCLMAFLAWPFCSVADEVAALCRQLNVPARFGGQKAVFTVEDYPVELLQKAGPEAKHWKLVRDRGRAVALITDGGIHLLAFRPEEASEGVVLPKGRWHIDTMLGAAISTGSFIPGASQRTNVNYANELSGAGTGSLVMIRRYSGPFTEKRERRVRRPGEEKYETVTQRVESVNRFEFQLDAVLGYIVDGRYRITMEKPPEAHQFSNLLCQGTYALWPGQARGDRTVITPLAGGYEGYANNLQAIDLSDNHHPGIRDGGFGAYLHQTSGWSPALTLEGADADFVICNAHADIDFVARWPKGLEVDGQRRQTLEIRHRLLALPPELTQHVWDSMKLLFTEKSTVTIRIGSVEDFEEQPVRATSPVRGIISTGGLRLAGEGRSGSKSLVVKGRVWPNLPQIVLCPLSRYRVEGWFKVLFPGPNAPVPKAYIRADLYESSPHTDKMDMEQETNRVGPGDWQRVSLEFTTPNWDPFVNIVFVCENGEALLDDFSLQKLPLADGLD